MSNWRPAGPTPLHNIDGVDSNVTLSYTHPLRPNTTHSISFYRNPGVALLLKSSSITQATGVTYILSHRLNQYLTLSPQVGWTHLVSLYSTGEVADLIQVGFGLQRTFTKTPDRHVLLSVSIRGRQTSRRTATM